MEVQQLRAWLVPLPLSSARNQEQGSAEAKVREQPLRGARAAARAGLIHSDPHLVPKEGVCSANTPRS